MADIIIEILDRLHSVSEARDLHAETGKYPPFPDGPGDDQGFDDWAADQTEIALQLLTGLVRDGLLPV